MSLYSSEKKTENWSGQLHLGGSFTVINKRMCTKVQPTLIL